MTTAQITEAVRAMGRCKTCKAVTVGETETRFQTKWTNCSDCGRQVQLVPISGRVMPAVKCGLRCTSARSASCDCSCGGRNHCSDYSK